MTAGQVRPARRRERRPASAVRCRDGDPERHHHGGGINQSAAHRPHWRGEIAHCGLQPAQRPDHHRAGTAALDTARQDLHRVSQEAARLRPDATQLAAPAQATKLALRSIAIRIAGFNAEIAELDKHLKTLVAAAAPRTLALLGVGVEHAAQLLITAGGNPERLRSEAAFAALCAACPIPASSGKTNRHRLNRAGDRDANRTLYMITISRLRYCPDTRAYIERRQADGLSKPEAIRCVKRYIARQTFHTIRADLASIRPRDGP